MIHLFGYGDSRIVIQPLLGLYKSGMKTYFFTMSMCDQVFFCAG